MQGSINPGDRLQALEVSKAIRTCCTCSGTGCNVMSEHQSSQFMHPASTASTTKQATHPYVHVQEVTNLLLGSYEQHIAAVGAEGLATAVILCLTSCLASTNQSGQQQQQQQLVLQEALAALKAFSITSSGQQVRIPLKFAHRSLAWQLTIDFAICCIMYMAAAPVICYYVCVFGSAVSSIHQVA
jgi:hypothetical protein